MTTGLPQSVAAEVRAELGRHQITFSELARRTGRSNAYWSRRLTTSTRRDAPRPVPLNLSDLVKLAEVLGVPVAHFMPEPEPVGAS